jgi:hypothetical protein
LTKTLKSSLLCPEGAALFERHPPHFSTAVYNCFGKKWKLLEAWLGPTALYLILAGLVIMVLGVIFRHSVSGYWARLSPKNRQRK